MQIHSFLTNDIYIFTFLSSPREISTVDGVNYKAYGGGRGIPHSLLPVHVPIYADWMHLLQLIIYTRVTMSTNYHWFQP